ncbi:MAG: thioredoxin domain-containing protein, partial [Burkholderiales bacterium]
HPTDLELCLRRGEGRIALVTLARMCEGGIYDQLGGGFCRYSVDAHWTIPHFEKMLYDNGPLLHLLTDAWLVSADPLYARCAGETAGWIMREMQSPEGGYYSSLDADSEHEEGKFYVWEREEVRGLLTAGEYADVAAHYGLDQPPNFENRHWHLRVAAAVEHRTLLNKAREKLFAARQARIRPGRDEKVLVSWNALAIRGMAHAGRVFGRPEWLDSARRALEFVRAQMWKQGRLLATARDGRAQLAAYLDDYAFLIAALLELLQAEFLAADLEFAEELAEVLLEQFEDAEGGGFFFTARDHEKLLHRLKPGHDQATPSGNGVAAWTLGRLAALTGEDRYARAAERTLELFYAAMRDRPAGYAQLGIALEEALVPPSVLVLRGERGAVAQWGAQLATDYLPRLLVVGAQNGIDGLPPLLDKPARPEAVNGWLCRGVTCLAPIGSLEELRSVCKEAGLR